VSTSVQYVADLESPAHIERVEYIGPARYADEAKFKLMRFGRAITTFVASKGQWAKISKGRGKLNITQKMIERAH
jgi:hypothetical protein